MDICKRLNTLVDAHVFGSILIRLSFAIDETMMTNVVMT
jgi:hypothetical protein